MVLARRAWIHDHRQCAERTGQRARDHCAQKLIQRHPQCFFETMPVVESVARAIHQQDRMIDDDADHHDEAIIVSGSSGWNATRPSARIPSTPPASASGTVSTTTAASRSERNIAARG